MSSGFERNEAVGFEKFVETESVVDAEVTGGVDCVREGVKVDIVDMASADAGVPEGFESSNIMRLKLASYVQGLAEDGREIEAWVRVKSGHELWNEDDNYKNAFNGVLSLNENGLCLRTNEVGDIDLRGGMFEDKNSTKIYLKPDEMKLIHKS